MNYRIGIVGTGMIAGIHAEVISEISGAELAAVCDRNEVQGRNFAGVQGCAFCTDLEDMLREVDMVSICTPSGTHLDVALQAIDAGKHILVEKPLEITVERCDRILEAASRKGVYVAGVFQSRFFDSSRLLKTALDEGRFGRLVMGDAYVKWFRSQEYYSGSDWKGTFRYDGGGALMNQSIHAVDLLQWFMGDVKSVQAKTSILGHEGIEVEDTAVAVLEFENGALGVIEGSTAVYPGFLKRIEISGTGGSAVLEEEDLKTWSFAEERKDDDEIRKRYGKKTSSAGGAADPGAISSIGHRRQYEDFLRAVENGDRPFVSGDEARKSVAIIQAVYESSRTGKVVPVSKREEKVR